MELETSPSFFPSLQIYKGTSPVCTRTSESGVWDAAAAAEPRSFWWQLHKGSGHWWGLNYSDLFQIQSSTQDVERQ